METQDVSTEFLIKFWPWLEANRTRLLVGGVVAAVGIFVYCFVSWQHGQSEISAGEQFTQIMFSQDPNVTASQRADEFAQLGVKYSGTEAGQRAQIAAAAALFAAGSYPQAQAQFQKYVDAYPSGNFASMAALGAAASLEAQGKLDDATTAYQKVTSAYGSSASGLRADFALGRIYQQQGKLTEAETYFESVANAGQAAGTMAQEAGGRAYQIKMQLAAEQKTSPISNTPNTPNTQIPLLK